MDPSPETFSQELFASGPDVSIAQPIVVPDQQTKLLDPEELKMIKPLNMPQLSSAKPRTGLQSVADLIPRLIRQYELQAQLAKRREQQSPGNLAVATAKPQQATFAWHD